MHKKRTILIPVSGFALGSLALASCSAATAEEAEPTASATDSVVAGVEHEEAQPRLVVTTETGVEVLSFSEEGIESLTSIDLGTSTRAVVLDDERHVALVDGTNGVTQFLDSGTYASAHGDHFHFYTRDAALRPGTVEGTTPVHVVSHEGITAVWDDAEGTVTVFDEISFTSGGLRTETFDYGNAHHGVGVPIDDGYLLTSTESTEGGLPDSIVQVDAEGETVATYDGVCTGLHGEAHVGELVAYACEDSIVVVDPEEQTTTSIAYPDDAGETRAGALYAGEDILVSNWGGLGFTLVDIEAGTITPVETEVTASAILVTEDDDIVVLGIDGALHVFDEDGDEIAHIEAIEAFEAATGHGDVAPALTAVGDAIVISDPSVNRLVTVDLHDGEVIGEYALTAAPTGVVATGLDPTGGEGHDHSDEESEEEHDH